MIIQKNIRIAVGIVFMLVAAVANASFYVNGNVQTAPGTFSWASQDMTNWIGVDATAVTGSNSDSAMFDGNANCVDGHAAAIGFIYGAAVVSNPVLGIYDLGQSYSVSSLEVLQGAGNGWWGILGTEVRVSNVSSNWDTAVFLGSIPENGQWVSPPGVSTDETFDVNMDIRYILVRCSEDNAGNFKVDEINVYANAVPEPATIALIAVGGIVATLKRRCRK